MSENSIPVITISREYGAGGRTIAKGLSEKLGIPWYDRDFVRLTAKISGYSEEEIDEEGEEISESDKFLESILNNINIYTSSHDEIFKAQKEVIMELAKNPCIIVGRCANMILRDAGIKSFDIFLHADQDIRIERAKNLVSNPKDNLKKYVERRDELRETYYKKYTGGRINESKDYTVCLDTGVVNYDTCIETLVTLIKQSN